MIRIARLASLTAGVVAISLGLSASQDPPAVAAGAALFQRSCASCHNVEGRAACTECFDVFCAHIRRRT